MLVADRLIKDFGSHRAVNGVSFTLERGEVLGFLGPNGAGKSTLLKSVAGYLHPVEGEMRLKGNVVRDPGPDRVMVFQEFDQLLPWKTVKENITFALMNGGKTNSAAEANDIAMEYIQKVKLDRFENTYPHMLSGGMKQRVAIARGMAMEPDILLMDEPFAALDALTRRQMQEELLELWDETRFTVDLAITGEVDEELAGIVRRVWVHFIEGRLKPYMEAGCHLEPEAPCAAFEE